MLILLLILIFIRPFISSLAFPYPNAFYSAFLIGFLAVWIIVKRISFKKIQPLKYPLILFCLAIIISVVFSPNRIASFKELYKYIGGLMLFLVTVSLSNNDKARILRTIVSTGVIISLLAIYQYFFSFQHTLTYMARQNITDPFALEFISRKRVFLPFISPNLLGGYLAMLIPLALVHKNKFWLLLPLCFVLLLTKSIGAFLSLLVASLIYLCLQPKTLKRKILSLLGILVIIAGVFISRSFTQKEYTHPIFSTLMRLNYWKDTLSIISIAPLLGIGLGNFSLPLSNYTHNSYLQIWAEMGILGLISFLWLIAVIFKRSRGNVKEHNYAFLSILIFLIHNLLDFSFFLPEVSILWWALLGLAI